MIRITKRILLIAILSSISFISFAQITTGEVTGEINTINSAIPFLTISPDSRGGAMGDVGVATSPDAQSMHWNPAKYAFVENDMGVAISYSPWLRELVHDVYLAHLAGFKRLDRYQVIGFSLRYFSLGTINFTNITGNSIGDYRPNEFALDAAYARSFSDRLSGSLAFRFSYSNLTGGQMVGGVESHPGTAYSADISLFYQNEDLVVANYDSKLAFGMNISNIGSKISYTENLDKDFIPANLKLGAAWTLEFDDYNSLMVTADFNKLLVPTPPVYYQDSVDLEGNQVVEFGFDPNVSVPVSIFRSFYDAPGVAFENGNRSVFLEEMRETTTSIGIEYWYANQFALRAGYFHEHATKGNRKFFTAGLGLKLNVFALDFSYLIPIYQNHPLANTMRFTLSFDLGDERR